MRRRMCLSRIERYVSNAGSGEMETGTVESSKHEPRVLTGVDRDNVTSHKSGAFYWLSDIPPNATDDAHKNSSFRSAGMHSIERLRIVKTP